MPVSEGTIYQKFSGFKFSLHLQYEFSEVIPTSVFAEEQSNLCSWTYELDQEFANILYKGSKGSLENIWAIHIQPSLCHYVKAPTDVKTNIALTQ